MPIDRERQHGTRKSIADRVLPLLGNLSAEKAKTETTCMAVSLIDDLQHKYATATEQIIGLQDIVDAVGLTAAVDELRQARAPRSFTPASESTHRSALEQPESTSRAELSERTLRTLGEGGAIRQDVDLRSMRSARSALLPPLPAASLASPAPSVAAIAPARALSAGAPSSSLAATIPANAPPLQPAAYKSMFAAPEAYVPLGGTDLDSASQQGDQMDMPKPDAQGRLAEQMHAEALAVAAQHERDVKAEALAAAARCESGLNRSRL
ncbi:hypothetical protein JKP88DRAFT_247523 [Tribonema minus]|uniref:Uncharacterized protein n=1 Tax=Tribonema minus TaxID=303371 RepID=A0A836CAM4_9STRA|nr:hypothetical protein JKP88DRAFT_247523 [Tribonema minus]